MKFKLILTENGDGHVLIHSFCPYCPEGAIRSKMLHTYLASYFPDNQKNYHGSPLKISASDKISVLMEVVKGENGKYFAKRGVYASVLFHLMKKHNFTYELIPSSGGGSTGHRLPNGTWVGTVGDIYSTRVDFGLMADVTYQRFSVVELCATVNYAYMGFASGAPAKIYTWKAIFWPFKGSMWTAMILSVGLSALFASILQDKGHLGQTTSLSKKSWNILSSMQYYARMLIEQSVEFPNRSNAIRIFVGFWLLFAIVGTTAYKSKIVSFMMFPVVEIVPSTFEELAESDFEIDFHYFGNVASNLFKTSTSPTFVTIYQRMNKEPDPLGCVLRTMTSKSTCIIFDTTFERLKYTNLSDRVGNSPISFSSHRGFMYTPGVTHEKKAAFSSNFKVVINTALEMGLIGEWKRSDFNQMLIKKTAWEKESSIGRNVVTVTTDETDVLHLPNLIGSFTIFGVGIVIAVVAFFGETIYFSHQVNKRRAKKNHRRVVVKLQVISLAKDSRQTNSLHQAPKSSIELH